MYCDLANPWSYPRSQWFWNQYSFSCWSLVWKSHVSVQQILFCIPARCIVILTFPIMSSSFVFGNINKGFVWYAAAVFKSLQVRIDILDVISMRQKQKRHLHLAEISSVNKVISLSGQRLNLKYRFILICLIMILCLLKCSLFCHSSQTIMDRCK